MLPYTTPQWHRFFALIGRDDLRDDPALADPIQRQGRMQELYGLIADALPARTTQDWVNDLLAADILFGEVLSPEALLDDPQLAASEMFTLHEHPSEGRIRLISPPVRSSAQPTQLRRLPPRLGEHSREILTETGLTSAAIDDLVRAGSIIVP